MSAVTGSDQTQSATPVHGRARFASLIRVIVLAVAGLLITFTATLHAQLAFDRTVIAATFAALAITHVIGWASAERSVRRTPRILLAAVAVAAAVATALVGTPLAFALVVAAWALVSGLLEFIDGALRGRQRQDTTLMGALGLLLAILVLLFRDDQIATLGFFGGYAIIGAVFLGISAVDAARGASAGRPEPAPGS